MIISSFGSGRKSASEAEKRQADKSGSYARLHTFVISACSEIYLDDGAKFD